MTLVINMGFKHNRKLQIFIIHIGVQMQSKLTNKHNTD